VLVVSIVLTVGTAFGQAAPAAKAQPMRGCLIDSLQPLFPDSKVVERPTRKVSLDVARGGTVAIHVLLNDVPPKSKVSFSARGDDGQHIAAARWFRLIDVPVEKNTGLKSFVERGGVRYPLRHGRVATLSRQIILQSPPNFASSLRQRGFATPSEVWMMRRLSPGRITKNPHPIPQVSVIPPHKKQRRAETPTGFECAEKKKF